MSTDGLSVLTFQMVAGTAVRKVKWSSEELAYIDLWMSRDDGDASSLAVSRCLTSIRAADNDTKAIFHPHHVLNSARLRYYIHHSFTCNLLSL